MQIFSWTPCLKLHSVVNYQISINLYNRYMACGLDPWSSLKTWRLNLSCESVHLSLKILISHLSLYNKGTKYYKEVDSNRVKVSTVSLEIWYSLVEDAYGNNSYDFLACFEGLKRVVTLCIFNDHMYIIHIVRKNHLSLKVQCFSCTYILVENSF